MNSLSIPWGKIPGLIVWLAFISALTCIMHAGLGMIGIPGLEAEWIRWALAAALAVAETLLLESFRRTGNQFYVIAAVFTLLGSLGTEFLNLSNGQSRAGSDAAGGLAAIKAAKSELEAVRAELVEVEARIEQMRALQKVWAKDGDASNDGLLAAAQFRREDILARLADAEVKATERAREGAKLEAETSAVAHVSPWMLLVGLACLKVGAVALGWSLGEPRGAPTHGGPGGRPLSRELGGDGTTAEVTERKARPKLEAVKDLARAALKAKAA